MNPGCPRERKRMIDHSLVHGQWGEVGVRARVYTVTMSPYRNIELPEIGAGSHPIRVVQWLVDRGAEVLAGDRILEVAATGVLFVVNAPCGGILRLQQAAIDQIVSPGAILGVIEASGDDSGDLH